MDRLHRKNSYVTVICRFKRRSENIVALDDVIPQSLAVTKQQSASFVYICDERIRADASNAKKKTVQGEFFD